MGDWGKIDKNFVSIKCAKIIVKGLKMGKRRGFTSIWWKNVENRRKIWKNVWKRSKFVWKPSKNVCKRLKKFDNFFRIALCVSRMASEEFLGASCLN
jgi:hypothetical protein